MESKPSGSTRSPTASSSWMKRQSGASWGSSGRSWERYQSSQSSNINATPTRIDGPPLAFRPKLADQGPPEAPPYPGRRPADDGWSAVTSIDVRTRDTNATPFQGEQPTDMRDDLVI